MTMVLIYSGSFIGLHIEHLYSASPRKLHRGAPNSYTAKKSSLEVNKNAGDKVLEKRRSSRVHHGECAVLTSGGKWQMEQGEAADLTEAHITQSNREFIAPNTEEISHFRERPQIQMNIL